MESTLGLVARFLLAGLHRFEPSQSAIREGKGTLLAASLYQSGPLEAEINYTWGGAAKEAQKPKAAKKPEAAAKAAEPEPDDKTLDPAAESNQAATSIPPATGGTAPISQHLPPREHGRDQIIPGAARGRVSPARLRLALELSSDLSAL